MSQKSSDADLLAQNFNPSILEFHVSHFASVADNGSDKSAIPFRLLTWQQLCDYVSQPNIFKRKEEAGLWNGGRFGTTRKGGDGSDKDSLRHVANVSENSLLFFDYDHGETFAEAIAYWEDMNCAFVAHTSFNHTPEHHKFRVIVPLTSPLPANKYKALWRLLAVSDEAESKLKVDRAPSSAASIFYVPARRVDGEYLYHIGVGEFLDWTILDLSETEAVSQPPANYQPGKESPKRAAAYLTPVMNGCLDRVANAAAATGNITLRNRTMILAGYLHYGVYSEGEIESQMMQATLGWTKHRSVESTIKRAIRDGSARPLYIPDNPNWKASKLSVNGSHVTIESVPIEEIEIEIEGEKDLFAENDLLRWTDAGMVMRLHERHGQDFRYLRDKAIWAAWNGEVWDTEGSIAKLTAAIENTAIECQLAETLELVEERDDLRGSLPDGIELLPPKEVPPEVKEILKRIETIEKELKFISAFFRKYGENHHSQGLRKYASGSPLFDCSSYEFDKQEWILNCQNGTLNLRTRELREFSRDDQMTQQVPVSFYPEAKSPMWDHFLLDFTCGDEQLRKFILAWLFYSLTGEARERAFVVWQGLPGSGKGVISRVMEKLLGAYHIEATRGAFCVKEFDNIAHQDFLAQMESKRFVVQSEVRGRQLDSELIKQVTGGDKVYASAKGKSGRDHKPRYTLNFFCNESPRFNSEDDALTERLRIVLCNYQRTEEQKKDTAFEDRLWMEMPGILANIVLEGGQAYEVDRLNAPELMKKTKLIVADSMNHFKEWLFSLYEIPPLKDINEERFMVKKNLKHPFKIKRSVINLSYAAYCRENGYKEIGRDRKLEILGKLGVQEVLVGGDFHFSPLRRLDIVKEEEDGELEELDNLHCSDQDDYED